MDDVVIELCPCPECGAPAEVVPAEAAARDAQVASAGQPAPAGSPGEMVGVRCVRRHWFFGLRDRLVA